MGNTAAQLVDSALSWLWWGSPWALFPELAAGGSGVLSRQPAGFWSIGCGAAVGFQFSQVESCLLAVSTLIFLQIKPAGRRERDFNLECL